MLALIKQVQQSPGAIQSIAEQLAPLIANELAVKYGEAAIYAANQSFNGVRGMKPDFVDPNIRKLTLELAEIRAEHEKLQPKIVAAKELVKLSFPAIRLYSSSPVAFNKGSGIWIFRFTYLVM